ncbi:MAG: InlB B-repeat-containing protein [Planctomycetota bacterium]
MGSTFSAWSGGAEGAGASITLTMTGDRTVTATFTVDP